MSYRYEKATTSDIDFLVEARVEILLSANKLPAGTDMSEVAAQSRKYYEEALADGTHTAIIVFDGDRFIGAGGVCYYRVLPTYYNNTGKKAYIMNMYTVPEYRHQGVASKTLDLLVQDAHEKGYIFIALEATEEGRPLYEKHGFASMKDEMMIPLW